MGDLYEITIFPRTLTVRINRYLNSSERKKILAKFNAHERYRMPGGNFRVINLAINSGFDVFESSIKLYEHPEVDYVKINYIQFYPPY